MLSGDTLPNERVAKMHKTTAGMAAVPDLESEVIRIGVAIATGQKPTLVRRERDHLTTSLR